MAEDEWRVIRGVSAALGSANPGLRVSSQRNRVPDSPEKNIAYLTDNGIGREIARRSQGDNVNYSKAA